MERFVLCMALMFACLAVHRVHGNADLVSDVKITAITGTSANVNYTLDRTRFVMDTGVSFLISLREGNQPTCSQFTTYEYNGYALTGLKKNAEYSVSILPFCVGGNPFFHTPPAPPKFVDGTNQPCDSTDSCYSRSKVVKFRATD